MILFLADNHYEARPGARIYDMLKDEVSFHFFEDDCRELARSDLRDSYEFITLNLISGTGEMPEPGPEEEAGLKTYLEAGGDLLLLHGSSAAFWHWDWWREIVGLRWVRPNDPDGSAQSIHPVKGHRLDVAKSRHPLCERLRSYDVEKDEIYIELEQTSPVHTLMTTTIDEGTFTQAYESLTPWGGRILAYIPGHYPEALSHPTFLHNVRLFIDELRSPVKG